MHSFHGWRERTLFDGPHRRNVCFPWSSDSLSHWLRRRVATSILCQCRNIIFVSCEKFVRFKSVTLIKNFTGLEKTAVFVLTYQNQLCCFQQPMFCVLIILLTLYFDSDINLMYENNQLILPLLGLLGSNFHKKSQAKNSRAFKNLNYMAYTTTLIKIISATAKKPLLLFVLALRWVKTPIYKKISLF